MSPTGLHVSPATHGLVLAPTQEAEHARAATSTRLVFIDCGRAMAVLMMVQGHTLHAVLAHVARTGVVFDVWNFARGLTSCIFLLLSGFTFTLATYRDSLSHRSLSPAVWRRFRRFGFFLLVGYALHFPMARLQHLGSMSVERWQSFLIVDVLQCIAVTLATLQILVLCSGTLRRYAVATAIACMACVVLTPAMWSIDWTERLPVTLAAYLSPATGSLFPLFPWSGYILLGAVLGTFSVHAGTTNVVRSSNQVLLGSGLGLFVLGVICSQVPLRPLGDTFFWSTSPNLFLIRSGLALLVLASLAHWSARLLRPPRVVQAIAQESLTLYAVHVCVVYGSVWNYGLRQHVGATLPLFDAVWYALAVAASMAVLGWGWHWCKHQQPGTAQWVRVAAGGWLLGRLL